MEAVPQLDLPFISEMFGQNGFGCSWDFMSIIRYNTWWLNPHNLGYGHIWSLFLWLHVITCYKLLSGTALSLHFPTLSALSISGKKKQHERRCSQELHRWIFPVGFSRQERAFGAPNDGWICLYINIYYIYMYCTYIYILCIKYILLGGDLSILKHMSQWEGSSHLWKIKFLFETTTRITSRQWSIWAIFQKGSPSGLWTLPVKSGAALEILCEVSLLAVGQL